VGTVQAVAALTRLVALALLTTACAGDSGESAYRDASAVVDDPAKLDAVLAAVPDDATRDMVVYRLAVDHPDRARSFCARMTTPLKQKCDNIVARPHIPTAPK
jgi:hypothetical protein